jgi:DNA repair exonuclease SbcCD ATPase subunit
VTELGAGSSSSTLGSGFTPQGFYNYRKVAFTIGWQSNILALLHGDFLQKRAERLAREREQLLADISARQRRVAALQSELGQLEAQNLLELEQRRTAAELQLRQERDALRRLEDRLKRVEQQRGTPPPPKP